MIACSEATYIKMGCTIFYLQRVASRLAAGLQVFAYLLEQFLLAA